MINVIIAAAGKSERFDSNKLLQDYGKSVVLIESIRPFLERDDVEKIIVVLNKEDIIDIENIMIKYDLPINSRIFTCVGGETRSESVFNALDFISDNCECVLIHDGARPNISGNLITSIIEKAGFDTCVIPVVDIPDSLYTKDLKIQQRADFVCAQTPQAFPTQTLFDAYDTWYENKKPFSDDFSLVQYYKKDAKFDFVKGDPNNIKITYRSDIKKNLVGVGYDLHNLELCSKKDNTISLCGVRIPFNKKLVAHSDGDVPIHALMDAILSAIGEQDIGHLFPTNDSRYDGISSLKLLDEVMGIVNKRGYKLTNVSIAMILEAPKVSPYLDEMKNVLSAHLGLDTTFIGITSTTNEGNGLVGSGDAIAALANVSIY